MEGVWSQEIPSRKFRNPNKPLQSEVGDVVVEVYGVDAVEEEEEEEEMVEVSGQGLYRPNGAKTGRLQSGWNQLKILSCCWTGPERSGVTSRREIFY